MVSLRNYFTDNNVFIFIVFVWILSIPFKNSVYQVFTVLLIVFFMFYVIKTKDYTLYSNC